MRHRMAKLTAARRRAFVGGSDARIIMGSDEPALIRLWREKRGEAEPEDLSGNLIVQLGTVTEELNRAWYERNTGRRVTRRPAPGEACRHPVDGGDPGRHRRRHGSGVRSQVHVALVFLGRSGGRKVYGAASTQHVGHPTAHRGAVDHHRRWQMGRDHDPMDPLYLSILVSAEKKFWRCVQSGETPHLFYAEPPRPRIEAVRVVDMSSSNSWAEFAALFCTTREAFLDHERAKCELKA